MAYDLEEQEQLDTLKAWWKLHGNKVQWLLIVGLAALASVQGWKYYQHQQNAQASVQFEALQQLDITNIKAVRSASAQIMEKYAGTPYAARAALLAAHANYKANDRKSAASQLEWVINNGKDDAVKTIAMMQLAGIKFEDKQYDAALKVLEPKHDEGFDGLVADLRGDILAAIGKKDEARKAYEQALKSLDDKASFRKFTEQKLDALGR